MEVQGTAEGAPSAAPRWMRAGPGEKGIGELMDMQRPCASKLIAATMISLGLFLKIVIASNNQGKLKELVSHVRPAGLRTGMPGEGSACLRRLSRTAPLSKTPGQGTQRRATYGLPALADDGAVRGCFWRPARWTLPTTPPSLAMKGDDNNVRALLEQMRGRG